MKTYLLFSDSHGICRAMMEAVAMHQYADGILFMGDGLADLALIRERYPNIPIFAVRGNCDFKTHGIEAPNERLLDLSGHKIFLTHGHLYQAKQTFAHLLQKGSSLSAEAVIFGHTHMPYDLFHLAENGETHIHLFNPGSIGLPIQHPFSFGLLQIGEAGLLFSHGHIR